MISKISSLIGAGPATATVTPEFDPNEVLDAKIEDHERLKPTVSPRPEKDKSAKVGTDKAKKKEGTDADAMSEASESEDLEPLEVLLQFIPYYGQGDPANDSLVRSTLSSLSVEDIDSKDEYGNTLLLLACQYRCEDLVRIMLNKGANPNAVNLSGACCLHFACYRESASYNIAKILLQNGANPDIAESSFGCTPLHYCAGNGDIEFCKLILSYGAQINAYDSYNYTCVDYAREAGFDEVASFLQQRLDKFNSQNQLRTGFGSAKNLKPKGNSAYDDMNEWESHFDPDTGGKYYINLRSGECLWESELKQRLMNSQNTQGLQRQSSMHSGPASNLLQNDAIIGEKEKAKLAQISLISQAAQATLVIFFTKFDPTRLPEVESLMQQYKGKEVDLANELKARYKPADNDAEFTGLLKKAKELKNLYVQGTSDEIVSDVSRIDPLVIQDLVQEARKKFESQLEEETTTLKKKFDQQMEEERSSYRQAISEKEGLVVKLQTELDGLHRDKLSKEGEIDDMKSRLSSVQSSGGQEVEKLEKELTALRDENSDLKKQIASLQEQLNYEREKLKSLELTMQNLTAGKEELIAREKAAAEERAQQQRAREEMFNSQLHELEAKSKEKELRIKSEFNQSKNDWMRKEQELSDTLDQVKKTKDREIETLRKELADRKAQFTQEISSALMQAEDFKKLSEDASRRAEEAEQFQKLVQAEIAEAKVIQKYNAQLHKDLLREQIARKKLHNDMEDLKGKIRVYVRVRPMSNSERERGSQEAVFKDGKMTVMLKGIGGPDAKKFYDFDQVFAGLEGNTQVDVFKDTKHLMMSVVDGYNVCIFAYGQTGAGKSFTMIGAADIGSCMSENGDFDEQAGITPRAVSELFRLLNERSAQVEAVVEVQMFQLYRDGLEDLLKEKRKKKKDEDDKPDPPLKITLAEHSPTGLVHVDGAETMTASNPSEVMKIFAKGSSRRTTASTQMNAESSRSHLICSLVVKLTNRRSGNQSVGKLTLVDLAGSERVDKSGATGEQLKEAQSINKSLSALGDVIAALTTNQQHVPYRNHPLTMLMSDSIGGNAKTLMFVNTSPADYNIQESNNSLAFANRCKDITNMVAAGPGVQAAQMNALKKELAKLKKGGGGVAKGPVTTLERPDTAVGRKN